MDEGEKRLLHASLGELKFDHVTMSAANEPDQRLRIYAAEPEAAARILTALGVREPVL